MTGAEPDPGTSANFRLHHFYRHDLGKLKGNKGNQQYAIPAGVDLRRYRSVIFWCVPFTQTLARANLVGS